MLLTMKDATAGGLLAGHVSFDVHGPTGLQNAVSAFRTFINLKDMGLQTKQFGSERKGHAEACEPVVRNESVTIRPIIIHPACQKDSPVEPSLKRQKVDGQEENGTSKDGETTVSLHESPVSAYICQLADIPGKFLPQKAASLGVPRGPLYGKLVKGETVQGANGRLVTPEEVMEPSTPGPTVILVDCPSEEFIPGLADTTEGVGSWAHQADRRDKGAWFLLFLIRIAILKLL
jgi:ribonuclease Z